MKFPRIDTMAPRIGLISLFAGAFIVNGTSKNAEAYSCGDPSANHCYAKNTWRQTEEYYGAYLDINRGRMICTADCGGFIDNEIWLIDDNTTECRANAYGTCWVEAGLISSAGSQDPVFFWADNPPNGQLVVRYPGPSDPAGVTDHFMIIKDGRVTPNSFLVFIFNDSLSTLYNGASVAPTGNPMKATRIDIGQELAGSHDAFADDANLTRNIWAVQALGPEYLFWYLPQTARGSVNSGNPPFGTWTIDPGPAAAPEGGQFTTHCCS